MWSNSGNCCFKKKSVSGNLFFQEEPDVIRISSPKQISDEDICGEYGRGIPNSGLHNGRPYYIQEYAEDDDEILKSLYLYWDKKERRWCISDNKDANHGQYKAYFHEDVILPTLGIVSWMVLSSFNVYKKATLHLKGHIFQVLHFFRTKQHKTITTYHIE